MVYKQLPNIKQYNRNGDKIDPFCGNFEMPQFSEVAYSGDFYDLSNIPNVTSSDNSINITYPYSNDSDVNSFDLTLNTSMVELIDFTNFHNYYIREVTDWTSEHYATIKHYVVDNVLTGEELTIVDTSQAGSTNGSYKAKFKFERNATASDSVYIPMICVDATDFEALVNVKIEFGDEGAFNTNVFILADTPSNFSWCFAKNIPFNIEGKRNSNQLLAFIEVPDWFTGSIETTIKKLHIQSGSNIFSYKNDTNASLGYSYASFNNTNEYDAAVFTDLTGFTDIYPTANDNYGVLDVDFFVDSAETLEIQSDNSIPDWIVNTLYTNEVALRNRMNEIILHNQAVSFANYYTKTEVNQMISTIPSTYDISAANGGTPYIDLAAALGTNGANVPADVRRGGMSIKFIQGSVPSFDNKYVQYRLMTNAFTTDVTQWQGVDDEPTAGSDNLVKSGGVYRANSLIQNLEFNESTNLHYVTWGNNATITYNYETNVFGISEKLTKVDININSINANTLGIGVVQKWNLNEGDIFNLCFCIYTEAEIDKRYTLSTYTSSELGNKLTTITPNILTLKKGFNYFQVAFKANTTFVSSPNNELTLFFKDSSLDGVTLYIKGCHYIGEPNKTVFGGDFKKYFENILTSKDTFYDLELEEKNLNKITTWGNNATITYNYETNVFGISEKLTKVDININSINANTLGIGFNFSGTLHEGDIVNMCLCIYTEAEISKIFNPPYVYTSSAFSGVFTLIDSTPLRIKKGINYFFRSLKANSTVNINNGDYQIYFKDSSLDGVTLYIKGYYYIGEQGKKVFGGKLKEALLDLVGVGDYIACWGDSLTAGGGWTARLSELSGRPLRNMGVGGERSSTILSRQGGDAIIINNITVPSGTTKVQINSSAGAPLNTQLGRESLPLIQGSSNQMNPVLVNGILMNLSMTRTSSTSNDYIYWLNQLDENAEQVVIDRPTNIISITDRDNNKPYLLVLFIGQNGGYTDIDDLILQHKLMINHAESKHVIVLGLSSGTSSQRSSYEAAMKLEFGRYFISLREYLSTPIYENGQIVSCYGMADQNVAIDPEFTYDGKTTIEEIELGMTPHQILADGVHYTSGTKTVIGNLIYKRCVELGIL